MPFLSIIIPTFNSSTTLSRAVDSILSQNFIDYEIWIIDGKSTDATIAIAAAYQAQGKRVNFISESDKGVYDAMNKGMDLAKGEWILFLGSDDELFNKNVLKKIHHSVYKTECPVVYGNVKIAGQPSWAGNDDIYDGEFDLIKLLSKNICHQAIFYKREFIKKEIGYYNGKYTLCADWDYNLRCWSKAAFQYTKVIVSKFNAGGITTKSNVDAPFANDFISNVENYFNVSGIDQLIKRQNPKTIKTSPGKDYLSRVFNRIKKGVAKS